MALNVERVTTRGCGAPCNGMVAESGPQLVQVMASGDGLPSPIIYRKGWALLGYLAVESNRMHSRTALATLLWPTLSETSGLTNLRQVLSNLKRFCSVKLGPDVLRIDRSAVGLIRGEAPLFDIDLLQVAPCQATHLVAEQRVFMDGLEDIADSNFQAWLETTRQMLEAQLVGAAEKCCDGLLATNQWERAINLARALTQRDPWSDQHARRLMHAHAGCGMRNVAVNIYQRFESSLRNELGLDPEAETQQLLSRISVGSLHPGEQSMLRTGSPDSRALKLRPHLVG